MSEITNQSEFWPRLIVYSGQYQILFNAASIKLSSGDSVVCKVHVEWASWIAYQLHTHKNYTTLRQCNDTLKIRCLSSSIFTQHRAILEAVRYHLCKLQRVMCQACLCECVCSFQSELTAHSVCSKLKQKLANDSYNRCTYRCSYERVYK